jgi:ATP-dependent Zn protease
MSGADVANIINEALIHSVFENKDMAEYSDIEFAIDKTAMGREKKNPFRTQEELKKTA